MRFLAVVLVALAAATPSASVAQPPIQVFLLAGQSNMLGRALPNSDGTGPTANLLLFRDGVWQPAADPLGPPGNPENGVGPGMTFGIGVLGHEPPGTTVGLIMCAQSSTPVTAWVPGKTAYDSCKSAAHAAGGVVAGILFLQGEREALAADGGAQWAKGFKKVEPAFEKDFGPVPFVLGQIGSLDATRVSQQQVRDAQAAADAEYAQVTLVTTTDLAVENGVHFTLAAQKQLGFRFADAWYSLKQLFPTLSEVNPDAATPGTSVTITGTALGSASSVTFGNAAASYTVAGPDQITVTVPDAGRTGPVSVTTPYATVASQTFSVVPVIDSFAPASGPPGMKVFVSGKALKGTTAVTVNGTAAKFKVVSPTQLSVKVPVGATSGQIAVTTAGGTAVSAGTFTVLPPP